ncbi:hypothetical protein V8D89_010170 [Ganoderma adspersum]
MADRPATRQCNMMTQRDVQCKRLVSCEGVIAYPNSMQIPVPLYCHDHLKSNLVEQRFHCLKYLDQFIDYNEEIWKKLSHNDKAGYIYVLNFEDTSGQDVVHFKVGWTVAMNRCLAEHNNKCGSSCPVLLSFYPPPNKTNELTPGDLTTNNSEPTLALSMIRPGKKLLYLCTLECLIHLELVDLTANSHPIPRRPCIDCGTIHEEIFTFRCLPRDDCGLEYELLVKPVIEKWGDYVHQFVSWAPGDA